MNWLNKGNGNVSESELIAYHLHELSPRRERAVVTALAASAALAADSAAVEAALRAIEDTPQPLEQTAFTRVWEVLQPALRPYSRPSATKPHWLAPLLAGTALAAVAAVSVLVFAPRQHEAARKGGAAAIPAEMRGPAKASSNAPEHTFNRAITDASRRASTDAGRVAPDPSSSDSHATHKAQMYPPWIPRHEAPRIPSLAQPPLPARAQEMGKSPLQQEAGPAAGPALPHNMPPNNAGTTSAQTAGAAAGNDPQSPVHRHPASTVDVMLALGGTFIAPHSSLNARSEQRTQTATHAIAALGALHQQFRPVLGYRLTLSYTRPDFVYTVRGAGSDIDSRIFEAAGTYVVQGPHRGKISTSADAGAALLAFLPTARVPTVGYAYRGAAVVGASADYAISRHWAARVTYRAQIFRGPGFRDTSGIVPVTTSIMVSHEPAIGIVYRFGAGKARSATP